MEKNPRHWALASHEGLVLSERAGGAGVNYPVARLPSCLLGTTRNSRESNSGHQISRPIRTSPHSTLSFPLPALRPSPHHFYSGMLGLGWGEQSVAESSHFKLDS